MFEPRWDASDLLPHATASPIAANAAAIAASLISFALIAHLTFVSMSTPLRSILRRLRGRGDHPRKPRTAVGHAKREGAFDGVHGLQSLYDEASMPNATDLRFAVVVSEWNPEITHALYHGCYDTLIKHGAKPENIFVSQVPGAFELPLAARLVAQRNKPDAVICLGCVIKGDTSHNEYINTSVASALMTLSMTTGRPFVFGVLTPNDMQQATDRAGGIHGNKGVEAAQTAIRMAALRKDLSSSDKATIGFGNFVD